MGSILSCSRMKILSTMKSKNKEISRVEEIFKYADWNVYLMKESSKEPARLTVVDFAASWCAPSLHLEPELNKLASNYTDIKFIKIDVDKLKTLAKDFKVDVVPTLVLLKQGKEVLDKTEGGNIEAIKKMIDKQVAANAEPSKPPPAPPAAATTN